MIYWVDDAKGILEDDEEEEMHPKTKDLE